MRDFVGLIGRTMITAGVLLLLFVAYQLFGTAIYERHAQGDLKTKFEQLVKDAPTSTSPANSSTTTTAPAPLPGDVVGRIRIPDIGMSRYVVNGVAKTDLQKGPGHYPSTPLPGQLGNASIAGHRTTYSAPFNRLDDLKVGSDIFFDMPNGTFHYKVTIDPFPVSPNDLSVLQPTDNATITLTTCTPKYSAAQRLIVKASLDTAKSPAPSKPTLINNQHPELTSDGLSGEKAPKDPVVTWGAFWLLVGLVWWFWYHRYHRWTVWLMGAIPFGLITFFFYAHLERILPSNY